MPVSRPSTTPSPCRARASARLASNPSASTRTPTRIRPGVDRRSHQVLASQATATASGPTPMRTNRMLWRWVQQSIIIA